VGAADVDAASIASVDTDSDFLPSLHLAITPSNSSASSVSFTGVFRLIVVDK